MEIADGQIIAHRPSQGRDSEVPSTGYKASARQEIMAIGARRRHCVPRIKLLTAMARAGGRRRVCRGYMAGISEVRQGRTPNSESPALLRHDDRLCCFDWPT